MPDLNCDAQDLLLEVVDFKQEVPDLRSDGIPPPNLTAGYKTPPWNGPTEAKQRKVAVSMAVVIYERRRRLRFVDVAVDVVMCLREFARWTSLPPGGTTKTHDRKMHDHHHHHRHF